jgi:hypothetical protein
VKWPRMISISRIFSPSRPAARVICSSEGVQPRGKYIYSLSGYSVWRYEEPRSNAPAPPHLVPVSRTFWFGCMHRFTSRCASLVICASANVSLAI